MIEDTARSSRIAKSSRVDSATSWSATPLAHEARLPEAALDEAMIAAMQEKVGADLRIEHSTNNREVTRTSVLKFTGGIGDTNPLWTDEDHASASDYGAPVAPPSWVICCFAGLQFGWPGLGSFHSQSDVRFLRPIMVGDVLTPSCRYEGFSGPRASNFAEQTVTDHFLNTYVNQRGEVVAEIRWDVINFERHTARAQSSDTRDPIQLPHPWTAEELMAIEADVLAEQPRGSEPRWWDDVDVGQSLDELIKGPIGMTDEVAFVAAGGAPIPRLAAHRAALQQYEAHPAWAFRDPTTGALEPIYAVHYNLHAAKAMGVAMQYDVGFQRQCWQVHLLTDWIGDTGWVKHCTAQYRSFVYHSDVVRLGGEVTAKYVDHDGEPVVEVRTHANNQRGQDVMPGRATLALPRRDDATSPVWRRARSA
jgi:acyl dehydratase